MMIITFTRSSTITYLLLLLSLVQKWVYGKAYHRLSFVSRTASIGRIITQHTGHHYYVTYTGQHNTNINNARTQQPQQQQQYRDQNYPQERSKVILYEQKMQRPILDQLATTLFQLERNRVEASSSYDEKGRYGEPMEWSNATSLANRFSVFIASNPIGYMFKQFVADIVAGDYDEVSTTNIINHYIQQDTVVLFSFTTCPFCRKAKDILDERNIPYTAIELDTMDDGNILRAQLGKITKRTSMPNIFIRGKCIGGCNDGYPGLMPLINDGLLDELINKFG